MKTINVFSHTDFVIDIVFQHEKKDSWAWHKDFPRYSYNMLIFSAQPVSDGGINQILHIDWQEYEVNKNT